MREGKPELYFLLILYQKFFDLSNPNFSIIVNMWCPSLRLGEAMESLCLGLFGKIALWGTAAGCTGKIAYRPLVREFGPERPPTARRKPSPFSIPHSNQFVNRQNKKNTRALRLSYKNCNLRNNYSRLPCRGCPGRHCSKWNKMGLRPCLLLRIRKGRASWGLRYRPHQPSSYIQHTSSSSTPLIILFERIAPSLPKLPSLHKCLLTNSMK